MTVKELFIYPITGFYSEYNNINFNSFEYPVLLDVKDKFCLRALNDTWWFEAISRSTLELMVKRLFDSHRFTVAKTPQYQGILSNPELFYNEVANSITILANLGSDAKSVFRALETMHIYCNLYTNTISDPFVLSLEEGIILKELSSLSLVQDALNPTRNPYIGFIKNHYLPILETVQPDLLWIVGPIKISSMAMAILAKELFPQSHISVTWHSSEYYSLNKLRNYLINNEALFSVIDSIILDDFENTMPLLQDAISGKDKLNSIPNLIYANRNTGLTATNQYFPQKGFSIEVTPYKASKGLIENNTQKRSSYKNSSISKAEIIDPSEVVDVKLWPNSKCYWDKCTFCAINRKYHSLPKNSYDNTEEIVDYLLSLIDEGGHYFWSIDEALPPKILYGLANELIKRKANIIWETRSKVDKDFTEEICSTLSLSGLREIRLGLEAASPRILSLMQKYPKGWSFDLVEQVVNMFHNNGVSVHFPTIIGFPTETDEERMETYNFLQGIIEKYPSVTFNINILGFDLASKLYEHYDNFGITEIRWPVPSQYFLGNLVEWNSLEVPFDYDVLDKERNDVMRELLYPWMPDTSIMPASIFYRLTETSRRTLVWKNQLFNNPSINDTLPDLIGYIPLELSPNIVVSPSSKNRQEENEHYSIYDWNSHSILECDKQGFQLLEILKTPRTANEIDDLLSSKEAISIERVQEDYNPQILKLLRLGIIKYQGDSL